MYRSIVMIWSLNSRNFDAIIIAPMCPVPWVILSRRLDNFFTSCRCEVKGHARLVNEQQSLRTYSLAPHRDVSGCNFSIIRISTPRTITRLPFSLASSYLVTSEASSSSVYRQIWVWVVWPGPWSRFSEAYFSETVDPISRRYLQGDRSIQATLITVGFGSFWGLPWLVVRAAWRVSKLVAKL